MAAKHGCDSYILSYIYDDMKEGILDFVPKMKDSLANMSYFNCFDYEGSYTWMMWDMGTVSRICIEDITDESEEEEGESNIITLEETVTKIE